MNGTVSIRWRHPWGLGLGLGWLVLFFAGLHLYTGSMLVYLIFSAVFSAVLVSGLYKRPTYGYLFLSVFIWLGFWFKLNTNFLFFGSFFIFEEPVGRFDSSPAAWDTALWVSICAGAGLLAARICYGVVRRRFPIAPCAAEAPAWYEGVRSLLWGAAMLSAAGFAVFNVVYGIHQIGITPRTILPWPLNALIAWMLNLGSAIVIAVLLWWDCARPRKIGLQFSAMLGEAFLSTVSVISRSAFPFHSFAQILALNNYRPVSKQYVLRQKLVAMGIFTALCFAAIAAVSFVRDHQYRASKSVPTPDQITATGAPNTALLPQSAASAPTKTVSSFRLTLIHQLLVNRWIGLEGTLAVSSSHEKGAVLFWSMLSEKREPGKVTAYQHISNSGYQSADPKYQFASLPGPTAFFLYSGSLFAVFIGMAMMTLLLLAGEDFVLILTRNPLLCSLFGMTAANTIAQFGITPRQDLPFFGLIFAATLLVAVIQSRRVTQLIEQLRRT